MKRGDVAFVLFKLVVILIIAGAIIFTGIEVLYRALYQGVGTGHNYSRNVDR